MDFLGNLTQVWIGNGLVQNKCTGKKTHVYTHTPKFKDSDIKVPKSSKLTSYNPIPFMLGKITF